jgi:hypothetical protein
MTRIANPSDGDRARIEEYKAIRAFLLGRMNERPEAIVSIAPDGPATSPTRQGLRANAG